MADTQVILGGISFHDYAVPEKINFGGKQNASKHTLIGGQRVVDAMGPEPDDIKWSGRFRGAGAIASAQAVDALRKAGAQVTLSWFGMFYTVLVIEFTASTDRFYEVPYEITCMVVDDASSAAGSIASSIDSLVSEDYSTASDLSEGLSGAPVTALTALGTAISAVGTLSGATSAQLLSVNNAAANAVVAFDDAIAAADPGLDTEPPSDADPSDVVSWLTETTTSMVNQAALADAASYVARIGVNLALNQG